MQPSSVYQVSDTCAMSYIFFSDVTVNSTFSNFFVSGFWGIFTNIRLSTDAMYNYITKHVIVAICVFYCL